MNFTSIDFAIFLPIVFVLYWFVFSNNIRLQNLTIVISSFIFYGWWDWRFLSLIVISIFVDYMVGIGLSKHNNIRKRKIILSLSIICNLGFLAFFKYYNFFLDNFILAFEFFGTKIRASTLSVILPVGISFYTFQTLSYSIDVYKRKLKPTKDFIAFSAFVSFFPQLVAGPIERASNLLPQFYKRRSFEYSNAVIGMQQIFWGLFKKLVIADNCAQFANEIFEKSSELNGSTLLLGAFLFTFQIYGDFSGYSDIAIGTSRLFGFNLMQNFNYPYFSRDIAEFWRRWHISLSTWFRDYLYIPLGGSRGTTRLRIRNTFLIFLLSGLWHGANWTYVVWGTLNAVYFLPLLLTNRNRNNLGIVSKGKLIPTLKDFLSILITFGLTMIAWIFFRAENIGHAVNYIQGIISPSLFMLPEISNQMDFVITIFFIVSLLIIEWKGRELSFPIENLGADWPQSIRLIIYTIFFTVTLLLSGSEQDFIYFQF